MREFMYAFQEAGQQLSMSSYGSITAGMMLPFRYISQKVAAAFPTTNSMYLLCSWVHLEPIPGEQCLP